ncbi:hypothetical protein HAX54_008369, partial [Datura stramonium]|nr:hypothetical protein [Datura stramonium]
MVVVEVTKDWGLNREQMVRMAHLVQILRWSKVLAICWRVVGVFSSSFGHLVYGER